MKDQVFGWTNIDTNSMFAWSNCYCNRDEFRRELQGKPICEQSILDALEKVDIRQYGKEPLKVHSFFPDKGIAYLCHGDSGDASIYIKWDVKNDDVSELKEVIEAQTEIIKRQTRLMEFMLEEIRIIKNDVKNGFEDSAW